MLQVTFPEIARVLQSAGGTVPAAESHGCLCGALCMSADYPIERWLSEIVPTEDEDDSGISEEEAQPLRLLFADTVSALRSDAMDFVPFLPDDDVALEHRTAALSQWCQGFLYGFGSVRAVKAEDLPATIDEVLRDVANISRAEVDVGDAGEEQEQAYSDVLEYLRAGVQLVHDELMDLRDGNVPDPDLDSDLDSDQPDPEADEIH